MTATALTGIPGCPVPFTLTPKAHAALGRKFAPIVCLCGSTRFYDEFRRANLRLTLAGQIVLSIGCDTKSDGDLTAMTATGSDPAAVKARLDELHKRKIDIADYVLVLNVGGYIGESTRSEIGYAEKLGKPVRYLWPGTTDPSWHGDGCGCPHCAPWDEWACVQCEAAYYGAPPADGLCTWCRADSPAAAEPE